MNDIFEKWAEEKEFPIAKDSSGEYKNRFTRMIFDAFKAGAMIGQSETDEWKSLETAPEGKMVRLEVKFEACPISDIKKGETAVTIGFRDSSGWHFAGWDWMNDHFTDGEGVPVRWNDGVG